MDIEDPVYCEQLIPENEGFLLPRQPSLSDCCDSAMASAAYTRRSRLRLKYYIVHFQETKCSATLAISIAGVGIKSPALNLFVNAESSQHFAHSLLQLVYVLKGTVSFVIAIWFGSPGTKGSYLDPAPRDKFITSLSSVL